MNFKKTLSVAAAAAMAMSVCAVSAYADTVATTTSDEYVDVDDTYHLWFRVTTEEAKYDSEGVGKFTLAGLNQTDIYGVKIVIGSGVDVNSGVGGGFGFNSESTGWKQFSWGNKDAGQEYSIADDNTLTILQSTPVFSASDTYCQLWIQQWWGAALNVERIIPLDKDGNEIDYASAIKAKEAEEAAAAETEAEETTAEVPAETEAVTEAAVEETVEEAVEEDTAEEDVAEEDAVEEEAEEDIEATSDEAELSASDISGVVLAEGGTSSNWGQAVVLRTYAHIDEGEEPGDDIFDPSILNEDTVIVVEYEADTAPELILQSWSGGEGWAKVPANEEYSTPGIAVFTYDYMTAKYGDDFSTLDALNIGDTGSDLTVTAVYAVDKAALDAALSGEDLSAEVEEEATADETTDAASDAAPAGDSSSTAPKTGNANVAAVAGIIAVASAAAVALKKRK